MWYVYILECKNKQLYTGVTDNVERRITEHREGKGGRFTRIFGVNKLVYKKGFPTKQDALKRESQIKCWSRNKKLALIRGIYK